MASYFLSKVSESIGQLDRILHSTVKDTGEKIVTADVKDEKKGKPIWGLDLNYAANNLMAMAEPRSETTTSTCNNSTDRVVHNSNTDEGDHSNNSEEGGEGCTFPDSSSDHHQNADIEQSRGPLHQMDASIPIPRSQSPCNPLHDNITQRARVAAKTDSHNTNSSERKMVSNSKANEIPRGNCPAKLSTYLTRHHPSHHLLFNVSSSQPSERTKLLLDNQIVNLPWKCAGATSHPNSDPNPENNTSKLPDCPTAASIPTLTCLLDICYALDAYLELDPKNVAVVYCSNGKTRTGIVIAAYLRYTNKVSTTFQGFRTFCSRTFRDLISSEQIDALIPPSLKTLFWNFDALLESGGPIQKEKMNLRAVTLQGVPVDNMPRIDIWDGNGLVYSSHTSGNNNVSNEEGNMYEAAVENRDLKTVMWADEEGFYRVNKPLFGDFLLLCRFGGQYAQDTADPTKVILRYANNTAFLFPGACELPKIKVDVMRRYADSISEEDFLITFLFERGYRSSSSLPQSTEATRGLGEWNYLPDVLEGKSAVERGWSVIREYHCVSLGSVRWNGDTYFNETNKIETNLTVLQKYFHGEVGAISASFACPNLLLLSLAIQLSNNSLRRAVDEFLEDRMKKLWKDVSYPFLFSLPLREDYEVGKPDTPPSLPALEEEDSKDDIGCAHLAMSSKSHGMISQMDMKHKQDECSFLDMLDEIDFGLDIEHKNLGSHNIVIRNQNGCGEEISLDDSVAENPGTAGVYINPHMIESKSDCNVPSALSHSLLYDPIISPSIGDITGYFSDTKTMLREQSLADDHQLFSKVNTFSCATRPKLKLHNYKPNTNHPLDVNETESTMVDTSQRKHKKEMENESQYPILNFLCSSAINFIEPYTICKGIDLSDAKQHLRLGSNGSSDRVEYDDCYRLVLSEVYGEGNSSPLSCKTILNTDAIADALSNDNRETALSMMMQVNHKNVRIDDLRGLLRDSKELGMARSDATSNSTMSKHDLAFNEEILVDQSYPNIVESNLDKDSENRQIEQIDNAGIELFDLHGDAERSEKDLAPLQVSINSKSYENILGSTSNSKMSKEARTADQGSPVDECNAKIVDTNLHKHSERREAEQMNKVGIELFDSHRDSENCEVTAADLCKSHENVSNSVATKFVISNSKISKDLAAVEGSLIDQCNAETVDSNLREYGECGDTVKTNDATSTSKISKEDQAAIEDSPLDECNAEKIVDTDLHQDSESRKSKQMSTTGIELFALHGDSEKSDKRSAAQGNTNSKSHEYMSGSGSKGAETSKSNIRKRNLVAVEDSIVNESNAGTIDSNLNQESQSGGSIPINDVVNPDVIKLSGMQSPLAVFGRRLTGSRKGKMSKTTSFKRNHLAKRSSAVNGNGAESGNGNVPLGAKVPLVIPGSIFEKSGQVIGKDPGYYTVQIPADAFKIGQIVITDKTATAAAADTAANVLYKREGSLVPFSQEGNESGLPLHPLHNSGGIEAAAVIAKAKEANLCENSLLEVNSECAPNIKNDECKKDSNMINDGNGVPIPTHGSTPVLPNEDLGYAKYLEMLKMGLTIDAMKLSLKKNGNNPKADFDTNKAPQNMNQNLPQVEDENKSVEKGLTSASSSLKENLDTDKSLKDQAEQTLKQKEDNPVLKNDPEYEKYFKMLKMGLPVDVVKHALKRDGKDESVMDLDPEKSLKSQLKSSEVEDTDTGPPLKEDPEYEKYFKMLKMGLPVGAVKNALGRDGKDPSIIDLDPEKSLTSQTRKENQTKKTKKTKKPIKKATVKVRRKKIFWNAVENAKIKQNSLWGKIQGMINVDKLFHDVSEFETLFTETLDSSQKKKTREPKEESSKKPKKSVQVIDGKRGMNGGIILARLKMDFKELANLIDCMARGKFDSTQLKALKEFLPTDEEKEGLKLYLSKATTDEAKEAAIADLCPCEKYMVAMMDVKNSSKKFECLLFENQFDSRMEETNESISMLAKACNDVKDSTRLRKLMAVILSLGNKINTGGTGNVAKGFTLDALLKLDEAKAFDRKTSVLQYLVRILGPYDKELLDFEEDIASSLKAKNIMLDTLCADIKNFKEEFEAVKAIATADGENYRNEDGKIINLTVKKSLAELKEQKSSVREVNGVKFYNQMEHSLEYTPMEIFSQNAENKLTDLCNQMEETQKKFAELLEYFGEDEKMTSTDFFGTLNRFTESFKAAKDYVEHQAKMKLQEEKRAAAQKVKDKWKKAAKLAIEAKHQNQHTQMRSRGSGDSESTFGVSLDLQAILKEDAKSAVRNPIDTKQSSRDKLSKEESKSLNLLVKPIAKRGIAHFMAKANMNTKPQKVLSESELSSDNCITNNNGNLIVEDDKPVADLIEIADEKVADVQESNSSNNKPMSDKLKRELRRLNTSYNPTLAERNIDEGYVDDTFKQKVQIVNERNESEIDNTPIDLPAQGGIAAAAAKAATKRLTQVSDKNDVANENHSGGGGIAAAAAARATMKRKKSDAKKGNRSPTGEGIDMKLTSRQIAAAAAAAAAAEADAEAALRRKKPNPLAFRGIVISADATNEKPLNIDKCEINQSDGNLSGITVVAGSDTAVKKVTMDRNTDSGRCNVAKDYGVDGAIAGEAEKGKIEKDTKIEIEETQRKSLISQFAGGGIAAAAARAAANRNLKDSSEGNESSPIKNTSNPFAGGGIAAAAARAAANRNSKNSANTVVDTDSESDTNKSSSNPFAGGGIAAAAARAAANRKPSNHTVEMDNKMNKSSPTRFIKDVILAAKEAQATPIRKNEDSHMGTGSNGTKTSFGLITTKETTVAAATTETTWKSPTREVGNAGSNIDKRPVDVLEVAKHKTQVAAADAGVGVNKYSSRSKSKKISSSSRADRAPNNRQPKSSAVKAASNVSTTSARVNTAAANRNTQKSASNGVTNSDKKRTGRTIATRTAGNPKKQISAASALPKANKTSLRRGTSAGTARTPVKVKRNSSTTDSETKTDKRHQKNVNQRALP